MTGRSVIVFARDPIAATGFGVQAVGRASIGLLLLLGTPGQPQAVLGLTAARCNVLPVGRVGGAAEAGVRSQL